MWTPRVIDEFSNLLRTVAAYFNREYDLVRLSVRLRSTSTELICLYFIPLSDA